MTDPTGQPKPLDALFAIEKAEPVTPEMEALMERVRGKFQGTPKRSTPVDDPEELQP